MKTGRVEAFSDGVLAIVITIMVLELKAPEEVSVASLLSETPVFLSYLASFIYIGIYWNNHHHLFQVTEKVTGQILWANLHFLFWISLIPFTTSWIGRNYDSQLPVTAYGLVLLMSALAYFVLHDRIMKSHSIAAVFEKTVVVFDRKAKISIALYVVGITLSFVNTWIAILCYVAVGVLWFIPDRRFEKS